MPPDRMRGRRPGASRLKRYEANIPRGWFVETKVVRDFQVNVQLGAFIALPFLGFVMIYGLDATIAAAATATVLAATKRSFVRYQQRRSA